MPPGTCQDFAGLPQELTPDPIVREARRNAWSLEAGAKGRRATNASVFACVDRASKWLMGWHVFHHLRANNLFRGTGMNWGFWHQICENLYPFGEPVC